MNKQIKTVAIIVAHPDDETLWAGGTILNNPGRSFFIAGLCRSSDLDRAPKFNEAMRFLNADGLLGDMDDGPEQMPLNEGDVTATILALLPSDQFDLVITHSVRGEYTRHKRHEEVGRAVINLWHSGQLRANELWTFAYEDGHGAYKPIVVEDAPLFYALPHDVWEKKYHIITEIYGFDKNSWEAQTTPKEEAFWQFNSAEQAYNWLHSGIAS
jgi:LmbE family N-acetylglucosaminyl deacetylase